MKALRPAEQDIDLLGRVIEPGDIIAYPVTVGRSAAMRIGRIIEKLRPSADYEPLAKVTKPDLTRWVIRVEYLNESMDWGIGRDDAEWDVAYHTEALCVGLPRPPIDHNAHFPESHWFEGEYDRFTHQRTWRPYEEAMAEFTAYHERELRLAQRKLDAGPKVKTQILLFPGKAVVINREFEDRAARSKNPLAESGLPVQ